MGLLGQRSMSGGICVVRHFLLMLILINLIFDSFLQVIFMTEKGENIFTKERLHQIHNIEKKILAHEKFSEFCFKDVQDNVINDPAVKAINGCAPLNSLLSYFFPSKDKAGNVFYDGLGDNMDNVDSALRLAMTTNHFYYYVDDKVNSSNKKSQLLRTEVLFGAPLRGMYL